jgi:glycosyltransferase involved in cell wall biosynthesis
LAGIVQDHAYYDQYVVPHIDNDKVVYIGSVGPVERNRLLGKALALLHPIQFDEPFGLSVIESMACGTPVIAFDRGSMPELIENGKNGFLVEQRGRGHRAGSHVSMRLTAQPAVAMLKGISPSTAWSMLTFKSTK